jgi:hypothetical protein
MSDLFFAIKFIKKDKMSNWKKNKLGLFRVNIYIYIYDPLDRLFIFLFVRMEHKTIIVLFQTMVSLSLF